MFYLLGYELSSLPVSNDRKETIASNAFLLTVDGDTGFKPEAVHLLIELMKRNRLVGAACGRIHPKGSGVNKIYMPTGYAKLQLIESHIFSLVKCYNLYLKVGWYGTKDLSMLSAIGCKNLRSM